MHDAKALVAFAGWLLGADLTKIMHSCHLEIAHSASWLSLPAAASNVKLATCLPGTQEI
jgi:hypothetical protein